MFNLKERWLTWREKRFLKKHYCATRKEYEHRFDKDVNLYSDKIIEFYHGYPHIHAFVSSHLTPFDQFGDWLQGLSTLTEWCDEKCVGKWRHDILRVSRYGYPFQWNSGDGEWEMDEMGGGDVLFFAFKSETDMLWFKLRWA